MTIIKALPDKDVIEGAPVSLHGSGDFENYSWDSDYAHRIDDPTGTNYAKVVDARFAAGPWASSRSVDDASADDVSTPAMSGVALVTYDAIERKQHAIFGVSWSYSGPTNGSGVLTVEDDGDAVFSQQTPSVAGGAEDVVVFPKGLRTSRGSSMFVRLTGVPGVYGKVSVLGHRME